MGAQKGQMKGVLSWLVRGACSAGTRDFCSALAALIGPVHNIFFLTVQYIISIPLCPTPSKLGRAVLGRLSLNMDPGGIDSWAS